MAKIKQAIIDYGNERKEKYAINFSVLSKLAKYADYTIDDALVFYGIFSLILGGINEAQVDEIFAKYVSKK